MPHFTPIIEKLPSTTPFVGPEALERRTGSAIKARIGANENVFGPSPKAIAAMQAGVTWGWAAAARDTTKQASIPHDQWRIQEFLVGGWRVR